MSIDPMRWDIREQVCLPVGSSHSLPSLAVTATVRLPHPVAVAGGSMETLRFEDSGKVDKILKWQDEAVHVSVAPASTWERFELVVLLVLGTALVCVTIALISLLIWRSIVDLKLSYLLMATLFLAFLVPAISALVGFQALVFHYSLCFYPGKGRYHLVNGALRLSLAFAMPSLRLICSAIDDHGEWGYRVVLCRIGKLSFPWPFIPCCIVGSKRAALQEALMICRWLRDIPGMPPVEMNGWGKIGRTHCGVGWTK
jgi:hypothetical protein